MKISGKVSALRAASFAAALAVISASPAFAASAVEEAPAESAAEEVISQAEGTESTVEAVEPERPVYRGLDFVTLGQYKGVEVEVEPIEISDEQIESTMMSAIKASDAAYDEFTEGTVEEGDIANIDYVGKKDGVEFDGGSFSGYDLEIGSDTFIPGFEEGLIGAEVGKTLDLNLTFPEEYMSEDLAGADVVFTVTVNSVKRMKELDDEVAKAVSDGEAATLDEYRELTKLRLEESAMESRETEAKSKILEKVAEASSVSEYPQDLVDYVTNEVSTYYQYYAQMYGVDLDTFLNVMVGSSVEDIVKHSIHQEFCVDAIAETEGLKPEGDDLAKAYDDLAERLGAPDTETLMAYYNEETLLSTIVYERVMDFLYENAVITEHDHSADSGVESAVETVVESVAEIAG